MIHIAPRKKVMLSGVIILLVCVAAALLITNRQTKDTVVKVQYMEAVLCTDDVPPSNCTDSEVKVETEQGEFKTYTFKGYMNGVGREAYEKNSKLLLNSWLDDQKVKITVEDGFITAVQ